jgi:hypothetical protein
MVRNDSDLPSPLPRTITTPSTTPLNHDKESNEQYKKISSTLRELLGLACSLIEALG